MAPLTRRRRKASLSEKGRGPAGYWFVRIDDSQPGELGGDDRGEEMVVRAAKDDGISAALDRSVERAADRLVRCGRFVFSTLDQLREAVAGNVEQRDVLAELGGDAGVQLATECPGSGEDGDDTRLRLHGSWLESGNHAHEGDLEHLAEVIDRGRRRGVTGDDDELGAGLLQPIYDAERALTDLRGGAGTIGKVGRVGEVDNAFRWGDRPECTEDTQATDSGIEHPNRARVHPG